MDAREPQSRESGAHTRYLGYGLLHLAAAGLLVYFFVLSLRPLADGDLWWHLKNGQWMLDNRALLGHEDPFSFTSPRPLSDAQVMGIRSQWLGQVVLYLVFLMGGYPGLALFRTLMITVPFMLLYVYYARRGRGPASMIPVLALPVLLVVTTLNYAFERPQAFSFLLSIALVPLLERLRRPEGRLGWTALLVLLMALWSNLHGAYIFGVALIAAFTAGVLVEAAIYRKKEDLAFVAPALAGVAATLLNPNGYRLLLSFMRDFLRGLFGPAGGQAAAGKVDVLGEILEYKPLWFFYSEMHYFWIPFMVAFMALAVLAVLLRQAGRRRPGFPEALVVAAIVLFGLYYSRGVTFALMVLPLVSLRALSELGKVQRALFGAVAFTVCAALVAVTLGRAPQWLSPQRPGSWVSTSYPEGAVRLIEERGIGGQMLSELRWGGYLIWRLGPERKVFMDGRLLDNDAFAMYIRVRDAKPGAMEIVEAFDINLILFRPISRDDGRITPLVLKFLEERPRGWSLIYMEGNAALFVRNAPENRRAIDDYGLPFDVLYVPILRGAEAVLSFSPGNLEAQLARGIALAGLGRNEQARRVLMGLPPSPVRDRYLRKAGG